MFDSKVFDDFMKEIAKSDTDGAVHDQVDEVPNATIASLGDLLEQYWQEEVQAVGQQSWESLLRDVL